MVKSASHHDAGRTFSLDDHDHDHDLEERIEDNPIWKQDNVFLTSVGIDVGSSGTQIIFSRLHLRRMGESLTSRYRVFERKNLYRSPIALTPYIDASLINAEHLGRIIDAAYSASGLGVEEVDTGLVILTGEAIRRRNAESITALIAERAGDLVCASAGHNMEAMLAAHGSGAVQRSADEGTTVLNVDIGGGTTKIAVIERGTVVATGAIHVGGRLQAIDERGTIIRLEDAGRDHAITAGFDWELGQRIDPEHLAVVGRSMAELLDRAIFEEDRTPSPGLFLTEPVRIPDRIDGVVVSGGVAEYFYGREDRHFGDVGPHLGRAFRECLQARGLPIMEPGECIRATALGASEYTVQLSGNTSWIQGAPSVLPRRNLQVLRPSFEPGETVDPRALAASIRWQLAAFDRSDRDFEQMSQVALALRWVGLPSYSRLLGFAQGIHEGMRGAIESGAPVYVVLDGDVAMSLGRILSEELGVRGGLVILDGVLLQEFDYVDLGRIRHPSGTVPVTIKSLVFQHLALGASERGAAARASEEQQ